MATGAITMARLTHATPGATYAHIANRDWEADSSMPAEAIAAGCTDIARQLVEMKFGDGLEVAIGGGRSYFLPETVKDPEYPDNEKKKPEAQGRQRPDQGVARPLRRQGSLCLEPGTVSGR